MEGYRKRGATALPANVIGGQHIVCFFQLVGGGSPLTLHLVSCLLPFVLAVGLYRWSANASTIHYSTLTEEDEATWWM